ncbi:MAG: PhnD/SsuA/transferrin family substrate-binding protein, partial [Dehalococcoidia bacterium]|nr:PhnD/SsuA/transferrin family substrate-binding protein [Dehalococcoidia bacterium]
MELTKIGFITFGEGAAVALARAGGLFEAQGLEVEVTRTPSSTEQMRGLIQGRWQIASTAFDNVLAWSEREGPEVVAVARASSGVNLPVYVRPEIQTWDDLRGKALAVDAVDTAYGLVLRRILQEHGLELDRDYTFVPAGATGYRLESMEKGETFAG